MNYLKTILLILIISTISLSGLHAQNIDQERMQRDLNIMEGVLEELLKSEWSTGDGAGTLTSVRMHGNGLSWAVNKSNMAGGSYFTDYGVLFIVTDSKPVVMNFSSNKNATGYFRSANNSKNGKIEINRKSIINRISEFLMDYGSTIKQLEPNENVTVVYKANNVDQLLTIVKNDSLSQKINTKTVPSMSVSATMKDLLAYRKAEINASSLSNRLTIKDINPKEDNERKLRIMSKILQTTFDDDKSDNFKISDVKHTYLEGFGAIFESRALYGSGLFGLNANFSKILRNRLKKYADSDSVKFSISNDDFSWSSDDDDYEEKSAKDITKAYDNFISKLKETVIDYGPTLSSVAPDESILVSLSVSAAGDVVPKRLDLRIKKSALEAYDKGNISRQQAMEQITIREY